MRSIFRIVLLAFSSAIFFSSCQNEAAQIINAVNHASPVVNAGPSRIISLPTNTVTLTGSATSANGPITGYLWSMVSGPNVPVIQTPGSATTVISNLVQGNYLFQLMAIDSAGYTGLDTASVTVNGIGVPVPVTLTLQPANNQSEYHFFGNSTTNQSGHSTDLTAATWTSGSVIYTRGAVKFDLSSIPAGATIVSARLTLFSNPTPHGGDLVNANAGPDNSMFISRISANWTAAGSTWATQPPFTTTNQVSIPHTTQAFLDLTNVDVKNLVMDMYNSGNYGFMIRLQNEVPLNSRQFCSSIYPDATKYPKLVVVYQ